MSLLGNLQPSPEPKISEERAAGPVTVTIVARTYITYSSGQTILIIIAVATKRTSSTAPGYTDNYHSRHKIYATKSTSPTATVTEH